MKRTAVEVYALAVCFVTVVCFVISLGIALYAAIGVVQPSFTLNGAIYELHRTNDAFFNRTMSPFEREKPPQARPPEPELTRQREQSFAGALDAERRGSAQSTVKSMIVVLVDLLAFYVHWRIAMRRRAVEA
jgi:hypothetical protein